MEYSTKRFYGKSITSFFSWFFVLMPYFGALILFIIDGIDALFDFFIAIPISYVFYFIIGIGGIGYVSIGKNIYCPRDFTPSIRYIQGEINISIDHIVGIEFKRMDGNGDGQMQYRMWDYSYLVFYLDDNTTKALYLGRFSPKQYIQIQEEIMKRKPDILLMCSAEDFLKEYKY